MSSLTVIEPLERRYYCAGGPADYVATLSAPPSAVVNRAGAAIRLAVTVSNSGTFYFNDSTIRVTASADATLDAGDTELASITRPLNILTGHKQRFALRVPLAALPDGTYYLFGSVDPTPAEDSFENNTSPPSAPVTVAAPFADLAISVADIPTVLDHPSHKPTVAGFDLFNTGNSVFNGSVTLEGRLSPDDAAIADVADVPFGPVTRKLRLRPGRHKVVKLPLATEAGLRDGNYSLSATLTSPTQTNSSNDIALAPIVVGPMLLAAG